MYGSYVTYYSGPISAALTNMQLFEEKRMCAKFQIDIPKTEGLVCVYTDRRLCGKLNKPCLGIKYKSFECVMKVRKRKNM